MERQAERAALVEERHQWHDPAPQVEERLRQEVSAGGENADDAGLIHHEAPPAVIRRLDQGDRRREAVGDQPQADAGPLPGLCVGRSGEPHEHGNRAERADREPNVQCHRTSPLFGWASPAARRSERRPGSLDRRRVPRFPLP
jgi:hypothetical protein